MGASQVGIIRLPVGSEPGLQEAVATAGPVSVAVDGSSNAFRVIIGQIIVFLPNYCFDFVSQFYDRGVFDEPNCSTSKLTQAMLVIGYGQHKGKDYWLVKNRYINSYLSFVVNTCTSLSLVLVLVAGVVSGEWTATS